MADDVNREQEEVLPVALVRAFVAACRAVMPTTKGGVLRTDEVRDCLTRLMVDPGFHRDYAAQLEQACADFGLDTPLDEPVLPLPNHDDAELAAHGFANVNDPDTLAAWAIDKSTIEAFSGFLQDIPLGGSRQKEIGPWFRQAQERWADK